MSKLPTRRKHYGEIQHHTKLRNIVLLNKLRGKRVSLTLFDAVQLIQHLDIDRGINREFPKHIHSKVMRNDVIESHGWGVEITG
ncbi:hypothetical protein CPB86DRAFT_792400 [Serendipita vermifera]|nr:hypothetical protein CPB86DRAFT_792400 [Serendipita vermifera]